MDLSGLNTALKKSVQTMYYKHFEMPSHFFPHLFVVSADIEIMPIIDPKNASVFFTLYINGVKKWTYSFAARLVYL